MKNIKHRLGELSVQVLTGTSDRYSDCAARICDSHGDTVALIPHDGTGFEVDNANELAAAPVMLHALKVAERFMRGFEDDETQPGINAKLSLIRAAIAKAQGEEATSEA